MKREDAYMLVACLVVFIVIPAILWVTVIAPAAERYGY